MLTTDTQIVKLQSSMNSFLSHKCLIINLQPEVGRKQLFTPLNNVYLKL